MSLVGYVRVSTSGQDATLQRDALAKAGCQRIFEDVVSGSTAERIGLNEALARRRASPRSVLSIDGAGPCSIINPRHVSCSAVVRSATMACAA